MDSSLNGFELIGLILSGLGSLALFLYGMKTMSEALQRLSGDYLRKAFTNSTKGTGKGFLSGLLLTGTIQSSTAITVLLVSFINAGLFTFNHSLAILIGANVGTTFTAWLITILGFQSGISIILLPLMAFTLPFLFRKNKKYRHIAELITGFVLIFTGFYFLKETLPHISSQSSFIAALSQTSNGSFSANLIFALSGIVITALLRSSSASTALTLVMSFNGWISFEHAAAMIVGANIGTTFTAGLAAWDANNPARRLALAHFVFNVLGALWCFAFFDFFINVTAQFTSFIQGASPIDNRFTTPLGLTIFHTGFNVLNAAFILIFFKWFKKFLILFIPVKPNDSRKSALKYIDTGYLSMSEMALMQVHDEVLQYGHQISYMFSLIPRYLAEKREPKFLKIQKKLFKQEEIADHQEIVISEYLTKIAVNDLTEAGSRKISSMLKIIDDIESIADECLQLEKTIRLKNAANAWLTPQMRQDLLQIFDLIKESIDNMNYNLANDYRPGILLKATELELKINNARDNFLTINRKNVEEGQYSYQNAAFFADLANHSEKIGDHVINVNQAIASNVKSKN